ncbi:hypothetical protein HMH01_00965 [Halovulum dunhuangense]|uniref:Transferrin-binding protein B C-lobe/N-lobe beta barrel domain-containing protein n=1 Tax=Halovulum dunhuangense TaxID=1505036 RepID=A0A849KVB4_9RHOB|nr:hypothetical protein [Halovulum dunhuangense]NNU78995.1 hypothetical protein [Halovulum dunhuangense]
MKVNSTVLLTVSLFALAACSSSDGGSGGGGGGGGEISQGIFEQELPTAEELAGLPQEAQDFVAAWDDLNQNGTEERPNADATYAGSVGFAVESGTAEDNTLVFGDISLAADFTGDIITGSMTNLSAFDSETPPEGAALGGQLDLSNGAITDSRYTADFGGDLTLDDNGDVETFSVAGDLEGAFAGTQTLGVLTGTVTEGPVVDQIDGIFLADQQP